MRLQEADEEAWQLYCLHCEERWETAHWTVPDGCPNCGSQDITFDDTAEELRRDELAGSN